MFQKSFIEASRDAISGAFGGFIFYVSIRAEGLPSVLGFSVMAILGVMVLAVFYHWLEKTPSLSEKLSEKVHKGGQPERKQNHWPPGRGS